MLTELKELNFSSSAKTTAPKYERLREHVVDWLRGGTLAPGDPLPSEKEMMEALGIARSTVRQALAALERDGLVRRVHGKGSFIEDDALRKLRQETDYLALVIPEVGRGFYPSLQSGFELAAGRNGSQIVVADTGNSVDHQASVILQLMDREVGGVAMVPPSIGKVPASQIRVLRKQGIPVVFCHRRVEGITAPLVTFDPLEAGRIAGRTIAGEFSHRRVAYLASHHGEFAEKNVSGLRETLAQSGADLPETFIHFGEWSTASTAVSEHEERTEQALRRMLESSRPPTAIYASFDTEAELAYLILTRMGLRVPDDISVVGFGGTQRDRPMLRQLTSVAVDEAAIGRTAAEWIDEIRNGDRKIDDGETLSLPLALTGGQTLAPPRKRTKE